MTKYDEDRDEKLQRKMEDDYDKWIENDDEDYMENN